MASAAFKALETAVSVHKAAIASAGSNDSLSAPLVLDAVTVSEMNSLFVWILLTAHRGQFEEGVKLLLSKWTALHLAVENHWGGQNSTEKAEDAYAEILEWFYKRKEHYADELEPLLESIILEDFNVQAEDGSPGEVSKGLVQLYSQCLEGDFSTIRRLSAVTSGAQKSTGFAVDNDGTAVPITSAQDAHSSGDEEDADMEMERDENGGAMQCQDLPDDGLQQQEPMNGMQCGQDNGAAGGSRQKEAPVIDDDGFQLVQRGRRR